MTRRCGAAVAVVALLFGAADAQTPPKKSTAKKRTAIQVRDRARADSIAAVRRADSLALVRADSLRLALAAESRADSIRRIEDSLKAVIKVPELRIIEQSAFAVGERLVFDVNYGYITAGEAVMQVARIETTAGRPCYRVDFTVNSLPSFSWIYKVEDRYTTWIDTKTIAPWRFEQRIREGSYKRDYVADFDQQRLVARTSEGEHEIPEYVHDILSAFYYCRTLSFDQYEVGDGPILFNFFRGEPHELKVKYLGRRELEIEAGTFRTIVVEPIVKEGGLFRSEGRIVIWLSDDDRKIPLRVNTKVVVGSIDTELRQYSGLAGPLPSRIR